MGDWTDVAELSRVRLKLSKALNGPLLCSDGLSFGRHFDMSRCHGLKLRASIMNDSERDETGF